MLQSARRLARCMKKKSIWPWRACLEQSKLPCIETRVPPDVSEVSANECEMMMTTRTANGAQSLKGIFVVDVTSEGIARIRRIRDHASPAHDLRRLADRSQLGTDRVKFEVLAAHFAWVKGSSQAQRAHPRLLPGTEPRARSPRSSLMSAEALAHSGRALSGLVHPDWPILGRTRLSAHGKAAIIRGHFSQCP